MALEVSWNRAPRVLIATLTGRIDSANSMDCHKALTAGIGPDDHALVLNMAGVRFLSSAGLRVLLMLAKKFTGPGKAFAVCELTDNINEVIQPLFDLRGPVAAVDDMGVAVDQPRRDPRAARVMHRHPLRLCPVQFLRRADPGNVPAGHRDRPVPDGAVRVVAGWRHRGDPDVGPQAVPGGHDRASRSAGARKAPPVYLPEGKYAASSAGPARAAQR